MQFRLLPFCVDVDPTISHLFDAFQVAWQYRDLTYSSKTMRKRFSTKIPWNHFHWPNASARRMRRRGANIAYNFRKLLVIWRRRKSFRFQIQEQLEILHKTGSGAWCFTLWRFGEKKLLFRDWNSETWVKSVKFKNNFAENLWKLSSKCLCKYPAKHKDHKMYRMTAVEHSCWTLLDSLNSCHCSKPDCKILNNIALDWLLKIKLSSCSEQLMDY